MSTIEIEVVNWAKYNPRSDRAAHAWFRVESEIMQDPKLFGLTAGQKFMWICLLAEVCRAINKRLKFGQDLEESKRPVLKVHVEWFAHMLNISAEETVKTILHLKEQGLVVTAWSPFGDEVVPTEHQTVPKCLTTITVTNTNKDSSYEESPASPSAPAGPKKATRAVTFRISTPHEFASHFAEFLPNWIELYEDEYLKRELTKALNWLVANPKKQKKTKRGWVQFFSGWFERGWDTYTTRGRGNPVNGAASGQGAANSEQELTAARVLRSLLKHGGGSKAQADIEADLGSALFSLVCSTGQAKIKTVPPGPFQIKNIASMLATTAELKRQENL